MVVVLGLTASACLPQAYGQAPAPTACEDSGSAKKLIEKSNNAAATYEDRRQALEQALKLCPGTPPLYNAVSILLLKHGAAAEALDWINRGLRVAPQNIELRVSLAVALESTGRAAEALQVLQQLPADSKTAFYIGMAQRQLGDHEAARKALLQAFESGYQDPYVLYVVIEQDRILGDKKAGLEHFQLFDQRFPKSPWLHLLLGDAYLTRNQDVEASAEYKEALKENPTLPVVHSKLGFLEFTRANYTEAAELFRQEIAIDPDLSESYVYLGLCLRRLEKNAEAIPAFEQAIARDPNSLNAYRQLAAALSQEGRLEDALRISEKGVQRFPNDETLQAQLARSLKRLGRDDEGSKAAERARQLREESGNPPLPTQGAQPPLHRVRQCVERADAACADAALAEIPVGPSRRTAEFFELQAETLRLKQNYQEALASAKEAVEADPKQPRYLILQGELYQKLGDQVSAIRSFLEAEKLGDKSARPVYSVGLSFFALGYHDDLQQYYDRAAQHFRIALQLDPQFTKAEFMLGVIDAVRAALPEARGHLEKALLVSPDNAFYRLHYGVILRRLGDDSGALEQFQRAAQSMPSYAPAHFNLGRAYASLGRLAEARTELEKPSKSIPIWARHTTAWGVFTGV